MTSPFVDGGRDQAGRFAPGNRGGPGNPLAGKVAKLRAALVDTVTDEDIREIARALVASAKSGDTRAIMELLDRTIGRPVEADFVERLEALEAAVKAAEGRRETAWSRRRLDALMARVAALGGCPRCQGRGVPGTAIRHHGQANHPEDNDPAGCSRCGKVSDVTTVMLHTRLVTTPPLPTGTPTHTGR